MTRVPRVLPVLRVNNTLSLPLILREIDTSPAGTLVPLPQIENEFNEDVMGPIWEAVEPPEQFDYATAYEHMHSEQPTSHIRATEEITSQEYDTWPSGTWVSVPQRENGFGEDVMGPISEVMELQAQFDYASGFEHMHYERPLFQFVMA